MEIKEYSDLTDFLVNEYLKITENLGVQRASTSMISFSEKSLIKYAKLYGKPLYREAKRNLILQEAINTMPHGWIWKFFHPSLWRTIKSMPEYIKKDIKDIPKILDNKVLYPAIVKPPALPQISDEEDEDEDFKKAK